MGSEKREKCRENRRELKRQNNSGGRLSWIRRELGLTQSEVSEATSIPKSTLSDMESNIRTGIWEYIATLARFYGEAWGDRFKKAFPKFDGRRIEKINMEFLMLGKDADDCDISDLMEKAERVLKERKISFLQMELSCARSRARQADMFIAPEQSQDKIIELEEEIKRLTG